MNVLGGAKLLAANDGGFARARGGGGRGCDLCGVLRAAEFAHRSTQSAGHRSARVEIVELLFCLGVNPTENTHLKGWGGGRFGE